MTNSHVDLAVGATAATIAHFIEATSGLLEYALLLGGVLLVFGRIALIIKRWNKPKK